jgi:hypothetical protein
MPSAPRTVPVQQLSTSSCSSPLVALLLLFSACCSPLLGWKAPPFWSVIKTDDRNQTSITGYIRAVVLDRWPLRRGVLLALRMRPAVAVRGFVRGYAWIIGANDQAPASHGIRSRLGAGRLTARTTSNLLVVCPCRNRFNTRATGSMQDMKIGRRNTGRGPGRRRGHRPRRRPSQSSARHSSRVAAGEKRNGLCGNSPQCERARVRRTRTRAAAAVAVLAPAGCGQAPQKPNRLSVALPAEYVKH